MKPGLRVSKMIDYLNALSHTNRGSDFIDVKCEERIDNVCNAIEKELGIQPETIEVKMNDVDVKQLSDQIAHIKRTEGSLFVR